MVVIAIDSICGGRNDYMIPMDFVDWHCCVMGWAWNLDFGACSH